VRVAANPAGIPGISMPCGFSEGLPVRLQLMAPAGSDAQLLRIARAYERALGGCPVPPEVAA